MAAHSCSSNGAPSYLEETATVRRIAEAGDRAHALRHCTSAIGLGLLDLLGDRALLGGLEEDSYFANGGRLAVLAASPSPSRPWWKFRGPR